jgi:hemerythrin
MFRAVSSRGGKYPHSTAHLSGHMNFLSPLERVVSNIKSDVSDWTDMKRLSLALNIFVLQHTDGSDVEYVRWYRRSGISPAEVNELITLVLQPGDDRVNIQIS